MREDSLGRQLKKVRKAERKMAKEGRKRDREREGKKE